MRRAFFKIGVASVLLHVFASWVKGDDSLPWRGVTLSCQTWGQEWATPEMEEALDDILGLGANAFAIHPYGRIQANGAIRFPENPAQDWIVNPARWAREKNLTLMLAPHLAYWGSPFSWRGDIRFAKAEEWDRFFNDYSQWLLGLARVCEDEKIPLLCIGLETSHAIKYEDRWRKLIAEIRQIYRGKLTYGANWNEYRAVPFWDAFDYVGVLAYFPLTTPDRLVPTDGELRAAWKRWLAELEIFSTKTGKPILFTELGYNESIKTAAQPWAYEMGGEGAVELQKRCLRIALEETAKADFLKGVFLWKWFPGLKDIDSENFDLRRPEPRRVISEVWGTNSQGN